MKKTKVGKLYCFIVPSTPWKSAEICVDTIKKELDSWWTIEEIIVRMMEHWKTFDERVTIQPPRCKEISKASDKENLICTAKELRKLASYIEKEI